MRPIFITKTGIVIVTALLTMGILRSMPTGETFQSQTSTLSTETADQKTPDKASTTSETSPFLNVLEQMFSGALRGMGKWEDTPFGRIRLISAFSGVRNRQHIYGAVEAQIKEGFRFTDSQVTLLSQNASGRVYLPLPDPKNPSQSFYTHSFLIPFSYQLGKTKSSFNMAVRLTGQFCQLETCTPYTHDLEMILPATESFVTSADAPILHTFQKIPMPASQAHIQVDTSIMEEGAWHVRLLFPKDPEFVHIYQRGAPQPDVSKVLLKDKYWEGIVLPRIREDSSAVFPSLLVHTGYGWYEIESNTTDFPTPLPSTEQTPWKWLQALILLFISLPFWTAIFLPRNSTEFHNHLRYIGRWMIILIGVEIGLLLLYPETAVAFTNSQTSSAVLLGVIALLVLLIRPWSRSWILAGIFWIMPKPYLSAFFMPNVSPIPGIFLLSITGGCTLLLLGYIGGRRKRILSLWPSMPSVHQLKARLLFMLPSIGILIWASVAVVLNKVTDQNWPLCPESLNELSRPTLVAYTSDVCYDCAHDRVFTLPTSSTIGQCRYLLTPEAQVELGRQKAPVYMFIEPSRNWRLVMPPNSSEKQLWEIIRELSLIQKFD